MTILLEVLLELVLPLVTKISRSISAPVGPFCAGTYGAAHSRYRANVFRRRSRVRLRQPVDFSQSAGTQFRCTWHQSRDHADTGWTAAVVHRLGSRPWLGLDDPARNLCIRISFCVRDDPGQAIIHDVNTKQRR